MTSTLKLHLLPGSDRSSSVLITALRTKTPFTIIVETPVSSKTEEYKKLHPLGKIPVAETPEGPLYESNTISRYMARKSKSLYGANENEQNLVDQWLDTLRMDFNNAGRFRYAVLGFNRRFFEYDVKEFSDDLQSYVQLLKVADHRLQGRQFLVGNSLTIADITLVSDLATSYKFVFTQKERNELPNLTAYFERLSKLPEFRQVLGHIEYPTESWPRVIVKDKKDEKDEKEGKKDKKDKKDKEKEKKK